MSDETNPIAADTLVIKPTSIEINNSSNGHHHHHSTEKSPRVISSPSSHIDSSVDNVQSSDMTTQHSDGEKTKHIHLDEHLKRESSPTSGVIIPEEKRVTDRVKVFEAVASNNEKTMVKNGNNNNKKKSSVSNSFSTADQKQVSPISMESFESQSMNEMKMPKNKSKKSSLKKQIQNLLKIDKPSIQDDFNAVEEQLNGKKNKKDSSKSKRSIFIITISNLDPTGKSADLIEPLEIEIPLTKSNDSETNNVSYHKDKDEWETFPFASFVL